MTRLIIFDGNAILHRAFHALPPMSTPTEEPINAVYGLVGMLFKVITDLSPTHLCFAFDTKEPTFRNQLYGEYQTNRAETATELIGQFDKARDCVQAFHIPFYEKPGFEADDVIGTITHQFENDDNVDEMIVVTGDRDMLQLVSPKVTLYMPQGGLQAGKRYSREETLERMGVYPEFIIDYKALVGDPSDNYKGIPGVGPKTAIHLIHQFGHLDDIYKNIDSLSPKIKEKLTTNQESAYLSLKLATIVKTLPVEFSLLGMEKWGIDGSEVMNLFSTYGFKTLTRRAHEVASQIHLSKQQTLL
jgi:DNA polymerase-1